MVDFSFFLGRNLNFLCSFFLDLRETSSRILKSLFTGVGHGILRLKSYHKLVLPWPYPAPQFTKQQAEHSFQNAELILSLTGLKPLNYFPLFSGQTPKSSQYLTILSLPACVSVLRITASFYSCNTPISGFSSFFCTSRYPTGNAFSLSVVNFSYFRFQPQRHLPGEVLPKKTCQHFDSLSDYLTNPSRRRNYLNCLHIGQLPTWMPVSWERESCGGVPPNASTTAFPQKKSPCYQVPMSRVQILPLWVISWSDGTSTRLQSCLKI